jgi:hypothetical protein
MLNYGLFKGKLNDKTITNFTSNLDYKDVQKIEERMDVLLDRLYDENGHLDGFFIEYFNQNEDTKSYFNVHPNKSDILSEDNYVCKQIEKLANYVLFCDEAKKLNRRATHSYLTSYKSSNITKNEVNVENTTDTDIDNEVNVCNYKKVIKLSVTRHDIDTIPTLKEMDDVINMFSNEEFISRSSDRDKSAFIKYIKAMRENQKFVKMMILKPIYFKQPLHDSTAYDMSVIDFSNHNHILALINNYAIIKQSTYEDLNSELRYVIMDFENLIDNTPLENHERDILVMKLEQCPNYEIARYLYDEYDLTYSESKISKIYKNTISKKIATQYTKEYNDWHYLNVERGTYKRCSACEEIKLVQEFNKKSDNKGGFQHICKDCEKKRRK